MKTDMRNLGISSAVPLRDLCTGSRLSTLCDCRTEGPRLPFDSFNSAPTKVFSAETTLLPTKEKKEKEAAKKLLIGDISS